MMAGYKVKQPALENVEQAATEVTSAFTLLLYLHVVHFNVKIRPRISDDA